MHRYRCLPDWRGETAAILGTGPSLDQDLGPLSRCRVIAVNDAWRAYPGADVLFSSDPHWVRANRDLSGFRGRLIVTTRPEAGASDARMVAMRRGPRDGLSDDPHTLNGTLTGITCALNFAALKGASRVLLIGVDLMGEAFDAPRYAAMAKAIEALARPLENKGIEVVNCSARSVLACFRKMSLAEALDA